MTLPPLNTPIQHTGGATCPVDTETWVEAAYDDSVRIKDKAYCFYWPDITTYTIIARAPADQIVELRSTIKELEAALAGAEHDQIDLLFEGRKYADAAETEGENICGQSGLMQSNGVWNAPAPP